MKLKLWKKTNKMNKEIIFFNKIVSSLEDYDWLVHNFYNVEQKEIYRNFNNFNKEVKYTLILDRNIFDYIIKSNESSNELHKTAIKLILYCQYLNIEIEPNLAIYEKYLKDKLNLKEVNEEYKKFQYINNSKENLVNFICGDTRLELENNLIVFDLPNNFDKLNRLKGYTVFELGILKLCILYFDSKIERKNKFKLFIDYCQSDFLISIPLIIYSIFLFDIKSINGIMKFRLNDVEINKKQAIYNMTWDIYNINRYYKYMMTSNKQKQYLFASADKLLLKILKICIKISYGEIDYINNFINDRTNLNIFKEWCNLRLNKKNIKKDKISTEFIYKEKNYLKNLLFSLK